MAPPDPSSNEPPQAPLPHHVNHNIETIALLRAKTERALSRHQRAIEATAATVGRPRTVYLLLSLVASWVLYNGVAPRYHLAQLDPPPFFAMQGLIALYAALVTTVVLAAQTRQARDAERQGMLELQINLLAEQKTAKVIALLEELRRDMPSVRNRLDSAAAAMQEAVDPGAVLSVLDEGEGLDEGEAEPSAGDAHEPSNERSTDGGPATTTDRPSASATTRATAGGRDSSFPFSGG